MALDAGTAKATLDLDHTSFDEGFKEAHTHAEEGGARVREVLESIAEVASEAVGPAFAQMAQEVQSAFAGFSEGPVVGGLNLVSLAFGNMREAVTDVADDFHKIGLAAEKAGVSSEFLGRIAAVGKTVDVPLEQIGMGFKILEQRVADAGDGNKEAVESFGKLGISVQEAAELSKQPEKLWEEVQDRLGAVANVSDRAKIAQELLGRGGNDLIPIFTMQRDVFNHTADTIEDLQGRATDANVKMSDDFNLLKVEVGAAMSGIAVELATPVLTYISQHKDEIEGDIKSVAKTIKEDLGKAWDYLNEHQGEIKATASEIWADFKVAIPVVEMLGRGVKGLAEDLASMVEEYRKLTGHGLFSDIIPGVGVTRAFDQGAQIGSSSAIQNALPYVPTFGGLFEILEGIEHYRHSSAPPPNAAPSGSTTAGPVSFNIHVAAPDPHESAMQVAQRLMPHIRGMRNQMTNEAQGVAMMAAAQMSMGGEA